MQRKLPITPRWNSHMRPGDYWPIALWDGSFAAGRVVELPARRGTGARTLFLAGLMNWHGSTVPSSEDLAGCTTLEQGQMGVAAFKFHDWSIIGNRPLGLDEISPWLFQRDATGRWVQKGLAEPRERLPSDPLDLPRFSTWGMSVIKLAAEDCFL